MASRTERPFVGELADFQAGVYGFAERLLAEERSEAFVTEYLAANWSLDPRDAVAIVKWASGGERKAEWARRHEAEKARQRGGK